MGQSIVDLSTQTLIADRVSVELQGRVYGAHFAWSHLWWVIAYPIAGLSQRLYPQQYFAASGAIGVCAIVSLGMHQHGHAGSNHDPSDQLVGQHSHYHFHSLEQKP